MSTSRTLSDEHRSLILRFARLRRERKRVALGRYRLESSVAVSVAITKSVMEGEDELTDEVQTLLSVILPRQASAHARLAGRAHAEQWLDVVLEHALKRVTTEVLR